MVTVKIKDRTKQGKLLLEYIKGLSFVTVEDSRLKKSSAIKKNAFLSDIEKGLKEVKLIQEGKIKPLTINYL
jgi:hypothetical protein